LTLLNFLIKKPLEKEYIKHSQNETGIVLEELRCEGSFCKGGPVFPPAAVSQRVMSATRSMCRG
jgi:hypothetical protein